MAGHAVTDLHGIQDHVDAVNAGEAVEDRVALIWRSNWLTDERKAHWSRFLRSFCLMASLEPYCDTTIDLGDGLTLRLNKHRPFLEGNELPGVRTDHYGDLVIEGEFYRDGVPCARFDRKGFPLWPLIVRDGPVEGACREEWEAWAFQILRDAGRDWPLTARAA